MIGRSGGASYFVRSRAGRPPLLALGAEPASFEPLSPRAHLAMPLTRKLRFGMVGGGPGAFIGAVHRRAATLDGLATLVAGSFSSDRGKSRAQGRELHPEPARV